MSGEKKQDVTTIERRKGEDLVPRLRFPEFIDAKAWKKRPLDMLARITQGGTPSTDLPKYWGGGIQWLTPAEMGKDNLPYISNTVRTISEEGLKNCSSELLPVNSVILSTRAPIGHLAINTVPIAINQGCKGLVAREGCDPKFIYFTLVHVRSELESLGAGNTFKELSGNSLKSFNILIPHEKEQQKIADCLSSLDDLINAESKQLEALKTHKKGLMQQLFPLEGETVPRLRFLEFLETGEWLAKPLIDIAPLQRGFDLPSQKVIPGSIPVVYSNGIQNYHCEGMVNGPGLVTGRSGTIGKIHFIENKSFWPHNTTLWVTTFSGNSPKFIYYLYKNIGMERFISGSGVPTLNRNDVHLFQATLPESNKEQQKIADCLSSLDDIISAQSKKIDALKTFKKGLMQQLFPVMDEELA